MSHQECLENARWAVVELEVNDLKTRVQKAESALTDGRVLFEGIRKDIQALTEAVGKMESLVSKASVGIIGTVGAAVLYQVLKH